MAIDKQEISSVVLEVIDKLLDEMPESETKAFRDEQDKLHAKLPFDSLNLVSLVVELEDEINNRYHVSLSLADEKALAHDAHPFRSVDALSNYVLLLLNEQLSVAEKSR